MKPHIGASIFREIAAQHDRSGADEATILNGIDYREKMGVSDQDQISIASNAWREFAKHRIEPYFRPSSAEL